MDLCQWLKLAAVSGREGSEMSHCGILHWYIPLLPSHWKCNETGSSVRQIWTDAAICCYPVRWERQRVTPTTRPSHVIYKHFLHSSSRWDNEYTKEQSLPYKWKQIYKITSLIDKYNKYFMHHNSGQLHLKQVCWQVTKKVAPSATLFLRKPHWQAYYNVMHEALCCKYVQIPLTYRVHHDIYIGVVYFLSWNVFAHQHGCTDRCYVLLTRDSGEEFWRKILVNDF